MTLILAVILTLQSPSPSPPTPTEVQAAQASLAFDYAMEDAVARMTPGHPIPAPFGPMIGRLGAPSYRDREDATKALEAAVRDRPPGWIWLVRGRRSSDPEIAVRCNVILKRISPCPACRGAGVSAAWREWPCSECEGRKTAWTIGPFD